jgi:predicted DNA-binding ribbon-helix-helix protein
VKVGMAKHSIVINGRKTSVSLEDMFWNELKQIAKSRSTHVSNLIALIDKAPGAGNLSSRIRIFVLEHVRRR